MFTAICPICGKQFTASKPRRFCSIKCRNTNNGRQGPKAKRIKVTCPICGKQFTTRPNPDGTPAHRYCSLKCGRIGGSKKNRKPREKHVCPICGKVFFDIPSRKRVYCSRKCMYEARHRQAKIITSICDYCGKEFTQPDPSNWKAHKPQRFCSEVCKGKGIARERGPRIQKSVTTFICEHCGKSFVRKAKPSREYHYCSRACFYAHHRGENHHCWQGGTDRYYGPNWEEQRLKALEHDGYQCQECGSEDDLIVHHIVPRYTFGQEDWKAMNELSNLVTLCSPCHSRLHALLRKDEDTGQFLPGLNYAD